MRRIRLASEGSVSAEGNVTTEQRLLAVVGPTASGKSTMAMRLAEAHGGELISCDSVQVYRDFQVGCAKPTPAERARVPHHLLDVVDWSEAFDAQRYRQLAVTALAEIRGRGAMPILCGGTGLYLRLLRFGLVDVPPSDVGLRQRLMAEEEAQPGCLYGRLTAVDPETAQRTEPRNLVHVVRALEIFEATGKAPSIVRRAHGFSREEVPMRVIVLRWPRDLLRARIEARSAAMLADGLLDEVRRLLDGGIDPGCRPMRSVGYKEACEVIVGEAAEQGLAERISRSTWAYARRQLTWFRRERDVEWLDVDDLDRVADALIASLA